MRKKWLVAFISCFFIQIVYAEQEISFNYLKLGQTLVYPLCEERSTNLQFACILTIDLTRPQDKIIGYGDRVGGVKGLKRFRLDVTEDFDKPLRDWVQDVGITLENGFSPWSVKGFMNGDNQVLQYSFDYCVSDFQQFVRMLDKQFGQHQFTDLTDDANSLIEDWMHPHGYALYAKFYSWILQDTVIVIAAESRTRNDEKRACFEISLMTRDYFDQKRDDLKYEPQVFHFF